MQRRTFIYLSAYTALALSLPLADGCASRTENALSRPLLFSELADKKTITEAGIAYRKQFPQEDDNTILRNLLVGSGQQDPRAIQNDLDRHVLQDFKNSKTVTAAGWVLALTEARQCALYSILNA